MTEELNLLALKGKRKEWVRIKRITETGAVAQYEPYDEPGNKYMPLIIDGKNVEEFKIIGRQLSMFWEVIK